MRKPILILAASALAFAGGTAIHAAAKPQAGGDPMRSQPPMRGQPPMHSQPMTKADFEAHAAEMFGKLDVNGDGVIDAKDREAAEAKRFAELDTDHNGSLSLAEFSAAHQRKEGGMGQRWAGRDGDMPPPPGAMDAPPPPEAMDGPPPMGGMHGKRGGHHRMGRGGPGMMMAMLRGADTNHDMAVTRAEWMAAADAHFAKMDTNGDGTVTPDERKAAHEAMRAMMKDRQGEQGGA